MHDFQLVAVRQPHIAIGGARHHFQIALHRDLGRIKLKLADEIGKARAVRDAALLAIDVKVQHIGHQAGIDAWAADVDRKSTRLNSRSLMRISYAVFCLKKKTQDKTTL